MNRAESIRAAEELSASPAAKWIGNKLDGDVLLQKCTRCGTEVTLKLPAPMCAAFQGGSRGDALAREVPPGFDETLFAWKRDFQRAHEDCVEALIINHAYLSAGDTAAASGDRAHPGCFHCGRSRKEHAS